MRPWRQGSAASADLPFHLGRPFLPERICTSQWKKGQQTLTCREAPAATMRMALQAKNQHSQGRRGELQVGAAHGELQAGGKLRRQHGTRQHNGECHNLSFSPINKKRFPAFYFLMLSHF